MYKARAEQQLKEFAENNDDTIAGRLINMAMRRFTSIENLKQFVSENVDDAVVEDARAGFEAAKAAASEFCDSGCVGETGR